MESESIELHDISRAFVGVVAKLYSAGDETSQAAARAASAGVIIQCLAFMNEDDRFLCAYSIMLVINKMRGSKFEDGQDFLQFVGDVVQEYGEEVK